MAHYKQALVSHIQKSHDVTSEEASTMIDAVIDGINSLTQDREMLILKGFGTFTLRHRKSSVTNNPRTGSPMRIPASDRLCFKQSKRKEP